MFDTFREAYEYNSASEGKSNKDESQGQLD